MQEISTHAEFMLIIEKNPRVFVEFIATWCNPCVAIDPLVSSMAREYQNIKFIRIDVDENLDTPSFAKICLMPTFVGYVNGKEIIRTEGAEVDCVNRVIGKLIVS